MVTVHYVWLATETPLTFTISYSCTDVLTLHEHAECNGVQRAINLNMLWIIPPSKNQVWSFAWLCYLVEDCHVLFQVFWLTDVVEAFLWHVVMHTITTGRSTVETKPKRPRWLQLNVQLVMETMRPLVTRFQMSVTQTGQVCVQWLLGQSVLCRHRFRVEGARKQTGNGLTVCIQMCGLFVSWLSDNTNRQSPHKQDEREEKLHLVTSFMFFLSTNLLKDQTANC